MFSAGGEGKMKKTIPLKKNFEFARIYNKGRFFPGKYMVIYVMRNRAGANRLGITASKKVGGSVRRNRVKRLIRENYRYYEEYIPDGLDIVFAVRKSETEYGFTEIRKEMKFLLKKVGAFDEKKWDGSGKY
jgi:ribonuclease P protein component